MTDYPIAPQSKPFVAMTVVTSALPLALVWAARLAPSPVRELLYGAAAFVVVLYVAIAVLMRPILFSLSKDGIELVWPTRRRRVPLEGVVRARVLDPKELRRETGYAMRVGAGGFLGAFGWAMTGKGTMELWVTRTDKVVFVERRDGKSLLITPAQPERFVEELTSLLGRAE
ncbi:MAG: hypothetical protein HYV07_04305 [Deltaproteobacteria bacterium]|nr:hypothetical protein [Deltaproteobacteria bacterium]